MIFLNNKKRTDLLRFDFKIQVRRRPLEQSFGTLNV